MVKQGPSEDDRAPQGGGLPAHRAPLVAYAQAWDSPLVALALTNLDGVLVAASATFRDRAGLPARPEGTPLAELAPPLASVRELLREGRVEPAPQQECCSDLTGATSSSAPCTWSPSRTDLPAGS